MEKFFFDDAASAWHALEEKLEQQKEADDEYGNWVIEYQCPKSKTIYRSTIREVNAFHQTIQIEITKDESLPDIGPQPKYPIPSISGIGYMQNSEPPSHEHLQQTKDPQDLIEYLSAGL